ncbi:MAG: hypothetical protein IPN38_14540 [Flavobacteriales bacterium]|nr:hypothetical protein [Flavobacteriales bacterium]
MLDPEFAALIAREGPKDEPQAFDPGSIHQFYKMQLILARMIYEGLEEYENCTRCVQLLKRIDLLAPAEP